MINLGKLIFLVVLSSATVYAEPAVNIAGRYRCYGNDFINKTTFNEPTEITKTGDTFFFTWINKKLTFHGTGILSDKTLAVVFWTSANMAYPGVVTYQVLPNGDLKGRWTIRESQAVGDEYCQKLK